MCGFCGTIYEFSNNINKINYQNLEKKLSLLKKGKFNLKKISIIFNQLKSDEFFFDFYLKKTSALNFHKNFKDTLTLKMKDIKIEDKSIIKNYLFFLDIELKDTSNFINNYIKHFKEKGFNNIIFLKTFYSIILSINYLEIRGRDSLGMALKFSVFNKEQKINKFNKKNDVLTYIKTKNNILDATFIIKTFNEIGYLGENSNRLIDKLFSQRLFLKLLKKNILKFTIVMHTRWASVGKINYENTHPVYFNDKSQIKDFISVNGDIFNYRSFINKKYNELTDAYALNFIQKDNENIFSKKSISSFKNIEGSFSFNQIGLHNSDSFIVGKKGLQGLYFGKSFNNRFYFASDLYGLAFDSLRYFKVSNDSLFEINSNNHLDLYDLENNKFFNNKKITYKDITISLRDVHKKNFKTYLEKEIYETPEVLTKTIDNYINNKNKIYFPNLFINRIIKKIINHTINEIIITGMGTCYTASVVIAGILRENFSLINTKVNIRPHIASEASAFYIDSDMSKTLVIAIAQSGTTIDTNTYVNMAKSRNAFVISFINKRDGDLSKIVHGNLYIGDGRDVEIAVPSTKTYSAHIFLGYLFAYYSLQISGVKINNIKQKLNSLKTIPSLIKINLPKISNLLSKIDYSLFAKYKNWFVIYEDDFNASTNQEIKIKLSELCYHSIPNYHIDDFLKLEKKNCIIIINTTKKLEQIKNKLSTLLNRNNKIFLISNDIALKNYKSNNLFQIFFNADSKIEFLFLSIVIFQIFSKNVASFLGSRAKIIDTSLNTKNIKNICKAYDNGIFNEGNYKAQVKVIINSLKKDILPKDKIILLNKKIYRPIDTIKHQAKTITVGTLRGQYSQTFQNNYKMKKIKKLSTYYLYSEFTHETYMYFLTNLLNSIYKKKYINYKFQFARNYEYKRYKKFFNFINLSQDIDNFKNQKFSYSDFLIHIKNIFKQLDTFNFDLSSYFNHKNKRIVKKVKDIKIDKLILVSYLKSAKPIKILGSGVNYNASKLLSLRLNSKFKKVFSFDVLENHKHIDISSESKLIILLGNITNESYQKDSYTEILKFLAHKNDCLVFIDKDLKNLYENIKHPRLSFYTHDKVEEEFSFVFYLMLFERYLF